MSLISATEMAKISLLVDSNDVMRLLHEIAQKYGPNIEFIDTQNDIPYSQRRFTPEIFKCQDIKKKLDAFENLVTKEGISFSKEVPTNAFFPLELKELDKFQKMVTERLNSLLLLINDHKTVCDKYSEVSEHYQLYVELEKSYSSYFYNAGKKISDDERPLIEIENKLRVNCLVGSTDSFKYYSLQKMIFRLTHGNLVWQEINLSLNEVLNLKKKKRGFIIFVQGISMLEKIKDICDSFKCLSLIVDQTTNNVQTQFKNIYSQLLEYKVVMNKSNEIHNNEIEHISRDLESWKASIESSLVIYTNLNKMTTQSQSFKVFAWVVKSEFPAIKHFILEKGQSSLTNLEVVEHSKKDEPTNYPLANFFQGFQELVNSYGVPSRDEINPMIFVFATYPFMFGLMFGDFGHGLILLLISIFFLLYLKSKRNPDEFAISSIYIVLCSSIMSIYAGLIYNEAFSRPILAFRHSFKIYEPDANMKTFLGINTRWTIALNKMTYVNSFKMKLSIIMAYFHQLMGMSLSVINHRNKKDKMDIFLLDVPRLIIFNSLIGYMVFWIFYKWTFVSASSKEIPEILPVFLDFIMNNSDRKSYFMGQLILEKFLFLVIFISLPVLVFGKPIYLIIEERKKQIYKGNRTAEQDKMENSSDALFSELIMHLVETFEFLLSTISNTASYLRIWALSLAHSVLSDIIWELVLRIGFKDVESGFIFGSIVLVIACIFWQFLTMGFLIGMEGMSAALHALRLHWVEFQNKFYIGSGRKFTPIRYDY